MYKLYTSQNKWTIRHKDHRDDSLIDDIMAKKQKNAVIRIKMVVINGDMHLKNKG